MKAVTTWISDWRHALIALGFGALAVVAAIFVPEARWTKLGELLERIVEDPAGATVAVGVLAGAIATLRGAWVRRPPGGGTAVGLALLVVLATSTGCGASALSTHATIGTVAVASVEGSVPLIEAGCDVALTGCHGSAECLERVATQCRDARSAWSAARSSVLAYLAAIEVMSHADEGAVLPALGSLLRSMAHAYDAARVALAILHVELPPLPAAAVPILAALMGGAS